MRARFGRRERAKVYLRHGEIKMSVRVLYWIERERAVCKLAAVLPIVLLPGQIGKAQIRRRVSRIGRRCLGARRLRLWNLLLRLKHLSQKRPRSGILRIDFESL